MTITIFHNPRCSKSRQTLALLEEKGIVPVIRLYLESAPSLSELEGLHQALDVPVREMMRTKEAEYKEKALDNDALDDTALLQAIHASPRLLERPIVLNGGKAAIGRPPENVLAVI